MHFCQPNLLFQFLRCYRINAHPLCASTLSASPLSGLQQGIGASLRCGQSIIQKQKYERYIEFKSLASVQINREVKVRVKLKSAKNKIKKMKLVLYLSLLLGLANAGKILFYIPLCSRSIKITFMPLATEMANRGHQVCTIFYSIWNLNVQIIPF